ncbi:LytR C-terminal domain-containing protein [candidate division WWE3 bacterium]|nr:LytR C-terminal domain-containing protein [candidate division WWE3 bacterium]
MPRRPARKSKARKLRLKGAFLALALAVLSIGFLSAVAIFKSLTLPFASASNSNSNTLLEKDVLTIAVVKVDSLNDDPILIKNIHLIFLDRGDGAVFDFEVPVDTTTEVPGKYGKEALSKVLALGLISNNDIDEGINLVAASLKKVFGFNIDRYVLQTKDSPVDFAEMLTGRFSIFDVDLRDVGSVSRAIRTNLSSREIYDLYSFVRGLSFDDFAKMEGIDYADAGAVDRKIREITINSYISQERKSVVVLNGTSVPGVAGLGSRVAENAGARVVMTDNSLGAYAESAAIVDSPGSATAKAIVDYFGIRKVWLKEAAAGLDEKGLNRADIVIIIGLDVAENL